MEEESHVDSTIGFLFDEYNSKEKKIIEFSKDITIYLYLQDEEPGALQSGHYLWPGARGLGEYLINCYDDFVPNMILELGAGTGLAGFIAWELFPQAKLILTDYDPGVLKLLQKNAPLQTNYSTTPCKITNVEWGTKISMSELFSNDREENAKNDRNNEKYTDQLLLLGADIIYSIEVVSTLFHSVHQMMCRYPTAIFILSYSFALGETIQTKIDKICQFYRIRREKKEIITYDERTICIERYSKI